MFIIPYSTDAPIYHWPFATGGMILACIGSSVLFWIGSLSDNETTLAITRYMMLSYGEGLHPTQWVTSNFVHAGPMHLLGNMFGLWGFGMIVEGKIGWWRFLLIFFGIGLLQCGVEQTLMLFVDEGASLGASSIIYGLLAICLVWAPKNDMNCLLFIFLYPLNFSIAIYTLASISFLIQLGTGLFVALTSLGTVGLAMSSEILHLMGIAVGFGVGVVMLKKGWVDCENWDLFSVMSGKNTLSYEEQDELNATRPEVKKQHTEEKQQQQQFALKKMQHYISKGQPQAAFQVYNETRHGSPNFRLDEPIFLALIVAYHRAEKWAESIPVMAEYLKLYQENQTKVRFVLAQILMDREQRPSQAVQVLSKVNRNMLDDQKRTVFEKLLRKAERLREADPYEIVDDQM